MCPNLGYYTVDVYKWYERVTWCMLGHKNPSRWLGVRESPSFKVRVINEGGIYLQNCSFSPPYK